MKAHAVLLQMLNETKSMFILLPILCRYMGRLMIAQFQNKETEKKYKKVFKLMEEINELREKIKVLCKNNL